MTLLKRVLILLLILIGLAAIIVPVVILSLGNKFERKSSRETIDLDLSGKVPEGIRVGRYNSLYDAIQYSVDEAFEDYYRIGNVRDGREIVVIDRVGDADKTVIFIKYDDGTRYILVYIVDLANAYGDEDDDQNAQERDNETCRLNRISLEFIKKKDEPCYSRIEREPILLDLTEEVPSYINLFQMDSQNYIYTIEFCDSFSLYIGTVKYGENLVEENEGDIIQKAVIVDKNGVYPKIKTITYQTDGMQLERKYEFIDEEFKRVDEQIKDFVFTGLF
ncbi:signal peptide containing protein [Theileria equi strain WA]|uniref:Signal peptide containing protein n=1 Tax=Theileria equi strain WA TaxID=1537102 RepID=L1LAX8_THEEQ|nr:signal peptide containing protein [Theileria equi strain WA]EKX72288.1 signal peptide containing protein [Theileria equi strain WA]|eukprot:XP_004831740.1 signal peptide containing protein [Theileria equi strain WA]